MNLYDFSNYWAKFKSWMWKKGDYESTWYNGIRNWVIGIATFTGSACIIMGFNPPGGYLQVSAGDKIIPCARKALIEKLRENHKTTNCAGEAVLGIVNPEEFFQLSLSASIGLFASAFLFIFLLLTSRVPLNKRTPVWAMSVGVCVAVLCTLNMFAKALLMLTPEETWRSGARWIYVFMEILVLMLVVEIILLTVRQAIWKFKKMCKRTIPVKTTRVLLQMKL